MHIYTLREGVFHFFLLLLVVDSDIYSFKKDAVLCSTEKNRNLTCIIFCKNKQSYHIHTAMYACELQAKRHSPNKHKIKPYNITCFHLSKKHIVQY